MDLALLVPALIAKFPIVGTILGVFGILVVVGQAYVAITPTQSDDAWFAKLEAFPVVGQLLKIVKSFAPIQRKGA